MPNTDYKGIINNINKVPALKLLIIMSLGIIIGKSFDFNIYVPVSISVAGLIIAVCLRNNQFKYYLYYLFAITCGIFLSFNTEKEKPFSYSKIVQPFDAILTGDIRNIIKSNNKNTSFIMTCNIKSAVLPNINSTKVLLYISHNDHFVDFVSGCKIKAKVKLKPPSPQNIDGAFDEKSYTANIGVNWLAFANSQNISIIKPGSNISTYRYIIVKYIKKIHKSLYSPGTEAAVNAMLLGDKTQVSSNMRNLYSFSGTSHILAQSGLHVGIIAGIIFVLLSFIKNQWFKLVCFTIILSTFIFIAGGQASAQRAGLMAVLILFARIKQRNINLLNILAFAFLIFVLFEPAMIYSLGFQMSISAIIGIVLLYTKFKQSFEKLFRGRITQYLSSSISLTISASLIVSPIAAWFFHTFSTISPLTNILAVGISSLGLCWAIAADIVYPVSVYLSSLFANAAELMFYSVYKINAAAVSIPGAYIQSYSAFLYSILIVLSITYIVLSNNFKQMVFRLTTAIIVCIILLPPTNKQSFDCNVNIYPRQQLNVIELKFQLQTYTFLIDRKPSQYPLVDKPVVELLKNKKGKLNIYVCGNAGIAICDELKKTKPYTYKEINHKEQRLLEKELNLHNYACQICDIHCESKK